ncbi:hypothetical protein LIER_34639 [Lithospermum erythrorhizon]|uniref:Zinc knuckle CX2CX4HX4C domain-containing protein n=1 Tax=Lithospermum erythrorhizon TaxID=34254 RepID=A0AAV3S407_LITER
MKMGDIEWSKLPCRVQIWNLPLGYLDVEFGRAIGAHIGDVVEVDRRCIDQERGHYIRVKVNLDIHKPLKRGGLVPMRSNKVQLVYRYENFYDVCLYYGMLGHEYYACDEKFNDVARKVTRVNKYDSWLLVHGERRVHNRWTDFGNEARREEGRSESYVPPSRFKRVRVGEEAEPTSHSRERAVVERRLLGGGG